MTTSKLAKNTFRCFHCRLVFNHRDGAWYNWESMQVHMCKSCDMQTRERPERA